MQGVSSMSVVVKANGVSEAFYNGQRDRVVEAVRAEAAKRIRKANHETEVQRDRADFQTDRCNNLRKQAMHRLNAQPKRGPIQKLKDSVGLVWAYIYAYTLGRVWIDILLNLGMIERVED